MNVEDYPKWVQKVSYDPFAGHKDVLELMYIQMGISGEAGELTEVIKKMVRKSGLNALAHDGPEGCTRLQEELGDVMWYVARMCSFLDISIEELINSNVAKLIERHGESHDVRVD